jgi:hypothetical protein
MTKNPRLRMCDLLCVFLVFLSFVAAARAQSGYSRHTLTVGAGIISPVSGWKTSSYDAGPAVNLSYGCRVDRHLQAEVGYTGALSRYTDCYKFGCSLERKRVSLMDYGLRAILPLKNEHVQISAGLGGGYIWNDLGSLNSFHNDVLIQYSGRMSVALDARQRFRVGSTLRFWRDIGRPTQQWLTVSGDFTYGFKKP